MELADELTVDDTALRAFCRRHGVRRLRLFGSAVRNELRPDSDIDLLVEFEPGRTPGLLGVANLELELQDVGGRGISAYALVRAAVVDIDDARWTPSVGPHRQAQGGAP